VKSTYLIPTVNLRYPISAFYLKKAIKSSITKLTKGKQRLIGVWAVICFVAMMAGAIGTNILPKGIFGIAERFSTFTVVVFNAVLGYYLFRGRFDALTAMSE
jgi:hypothetical protein